LNVLDKRIAITEEICSKTGDDDCALLYTKMWFLSDGFKLTYAGHKILQEHMPVDSGATWMISECLLISKVLIFLNRTLTGPYYIHYNKIALYGHKDIVLITLYGSIDDYINKMIWD
jgi:hypothetical protein